MDVKKNILDKWNTYPLFTLSVDSKTITFVQAEMEWWYGSLNEILPIVWAFKYTVPCLWDCLEDAGGMALWEEMYYWRWLWEFHDSQQLNFVLSDSCFQFDKWVLKP